MGRRPGLPQTVRRGAVRDCGEDPTHTRLPCGVRFLDGWRQVRVGEGGVGGRGHGGGGGVGWLVGVIGGCTHAMHCRSRVAIDPGGGGGGGGGGG